MSAKPWAEPGSEQEEVAAFRRTRLIARIICAAFQPEEGRCACGSPDACRQYTDWWAEAGAIVRIVRDEALEDVALMLTDGIPEDPLRQDAEDRDSLGFAEIVRSMKADVPAAGGDDL